MLMGRKGTFRSTPAALNRKQRGGVIYRAVVKRRRRGKGL